MKTLLPSLALLLAPALAAALGPDIPLSDMGDLPVETAPTETGTVFVNDPGGMGVGTGTRMPDGSVMGPLCPPDICGAKESSAFNLAEIVVTAKKEAVEDKVAASAVKAGAKADPFLVPGMRWVPSCGHQGPPCRQEPDPSKVGPTDIVVANANGEKIDGADGMRDAAAARKRAEEERRRQADPNGQYDPTGLGGIRRPPVVAPDRSPGDNGASAVAGLIVDGWNQMGVGDAGTGTGPSSQQESNVMEGSYGPVIGVRGVTFETASASKGGIKQLANDTQAPISFLEKVAGAGADGVSAGNNTVDDGTQGCTQGQGGDMTPCLGVSRQ